VRRVLDPAVGLAPGQLKHPGQQPGGGAEPGDGTGFLVLEFGHHLDHPRIGPPHLGFGRAQFVEQPVDTGCLRTILNRHHGPIIAPDPDNFGNVSHRQPRKIRDWAAFKPGFIEGCVATGSIRRRRSLFAIRKADCD
jgi:hypothetical protein